MKKLFAAFIFSGIFVALCSFSAFAAVTPIAASNSFTGSLEIKDTDNFLYIFNFEENIEIDHFELILKYSDVHSNINDNPNSVGEKWYANQNSVEINRFLLIPDTANSLTTQIFQFYKNDLQELFSKFSTDGYFALAFTETTGGVDSFKLHSASLNIYGTPPAVPIPGAALLLGPVLLGLVGIRRKHAA